MQPIDIIKQAREILAERWNGDVGYGKVYGPVCLVGGLVEPVRVSHAPSKYNVPDNVDPDLGDAFDSCIETVWSCLPEKFQSEGAYDLIHKRCDIEDFSDFSDDVEAILSVIDCAIDKAAG